jgi:hypothetical protein
VRRLADETGRPAVDRLREGLAGLLAELGSEPTEYLGAARDERDRNELGAHFKPGRREVCA